jgi:Mg2+ and Co2+ transporter CorA
LTDLREMWIKQVEQYYRDTYPSPMRKKVIQLLPSDKTLLTTLFDIVIEDPDAWKRTIKVPDVVAVKKARYRMYEERPDLRPESYNRQIQHDKKLLPEETEGMREEVNRLLHNLVNKLNKKMNN